MVSNQHNNEQRKLNERVDEFIDDDADAYEEGDVTGFMEHKFLPGPNSGINSFNVSFSSVFFFPSLRFSLVLRENKAKFTNC